MSTFSFISRSTSSLFLTATKIVVPPVSQIGLATFHPKLRSPQIQFALDHSNPDHLTPHSFRPTSFSLRVQFSSPFILSPQIISPHVSFTTFFSISGSFWPTFISTHGLLTQGSMRPAIASPHIN